MSPYARNTRPFQYIIWLSFFCRCKDHLIRFCPFWPKIDPFVLCFQRRVSFRILLPISKEMCWLLLLLLENSKQVWSSTALSRPCWKQLSINCGSHNFSHVCSKDANNLEIRHEFPCINKALVYLFMGPLKKPSLRFLMVKIPPLKAFLSWRIFFNPISRVYFLFFTFSMNSHLNARIHLKF